MTRPTRETTSASMARPRTHRRIPGPPCGAAPDRIHVWTCLALAATVAGARPAAAQRPAGDSLPPVGTRIRISAPPARHVTGTVLAYRGDTLVVRRATWNGAESASIALADVRQLEVSVGKRRRLTKGAVLGLVGGAATGALAGAALYSNEPSRCYQDGQEVPCFISLDFGRGFTAMFGGVLGGATGLVAGLVVGARRVDRWQPVDSTRRTSPLRVVPRADRSGVGVAFSTAF